MNEYRIFFEHTDYGYYSITMDDYNSIQEALDYFIENWKYKKVYGIMQI